MSKYLFHNQFCFVQFLFSKIFHVFIPNKLRLGHLNIGPVYRVGQVEIEHSSKSLLFEETEGKNLLRESGILDFLWYCVFRVSRSETLDPLGAHSAPDPSWIEH